MCQREGGRVARVVLYRKLGSPSEKPHSTCIACGSRGIGYIYGSIVAILSWEGQEGSKEKDGLSGTCSECYRQGGIGIAFLVIIRYREKIESTPVRQTAEEKNSVHCSDLEQLNIILVFTGFVRIQNFVSAIFTILKINRIALTYLQQSRGSRIVKDYEGDGCEANLSGSPLPPKRMSGSR